MIVLKDVDAPSFVLWKWTKEDYEKPVKIVIDEAEILFRYRLESFYKKDKKLPDRQMPSDGLLTITIKNPPAEFLDGLKNPSGNNAQEAAKKIYSFYERALEKVTLYGRWAAKLTSIIDVHKNSFDEIFHGIGILHTDNVHWRIGNQNWELFRLETKKKNRKINPMFKSRHLLTPKKWNAINNFAAANLELGKEIEELVRIKSKAAWGSKRIPTIETAALIEVVIRNKIQVVLKQQGQSDRKIDNVNDEISLSILLNILLPLILNKSEVKRYKKDIDALDLLRKVRNDIMHRNIPENEINLETVRNGVDAAIKIIQLLNLKIKTA